MRPGLRSDLPRGVHARRVLAALLPAPAPAAIALTIAPWRSRLPDPLPTHWSGSEPDGFTAYGTFATGLVVAGAVAALVAIAAALAPRVSGAVARAVATATAAVAWGAAGIWGATAIVAWDAADARSVEIGGWVLVALAAAGLGGALAFAVHGRSAAEVAPLPAGAHVPVMEIGPDERVVWTRRLFAPAFLIVAIVPLLGVALVVLTGAPLAVALVPLLAAVPALAFSSLRIVVDRRGVRVEVLGGIPVKRIAVEDVAQASVEQIRPLEWGGWGYRLMPGRSAVVLRAGPGLVVRDTGGRSFAITIDDPETPAGLLNGLRT